jgi:hypothetical protein
MVLNVLSFVSPVILSMNCSRTTVKTMLKFLQFSILLAIHGRGRSQWPRGLRRGSAAARLLRLWVRMPPEACESYVLSGRSLCVGLITRPEESYRVCGVSECDCEASIMSRSWPTRGCCAIGKNYMEVLIFAM